MGVVGTSGATTPVEAQDADEEWPQYQYDAHNSGYSAANTAPSDWVDEKWRTAIEGDPTAPIVKDGTVLIGADGDQSGVYAFDTDDGSELWQFDEPEYVSYPPAISGETVYVNGDTLYALDTTDGSVKWTNDNANWVSQPVVVDDMLYVAQRNSVTAVNTTDGTEAWSTEIFDQTFTFQIGVERGTVVCVSTAQFTNEENSEWPADKVVAVDAGDGSVNWETEMNESSPAEPTLQADTVYVATDNVVAIDIEGGTERWRRDISSRYSLAVPSSTASDAVYVVGDDETLYALDRSDGTTQWTIDGPSNAPVVVDES